MSRNRIDLSLYMRVTVDHQIRDNVARILRMLAPSQKVTDKDVLHYLFEGACEHDNSWPYQIEAQAPEGELWVARTLFSASYDDFDQVWLNDVSTKDEVTVATRDLNLHKVRIEAHRMGLVCWYDAADRPFPKKMIG